MYIQIYLTLNLAICTLFFIKNDPLHIKQIKLTAILVVSINDVLESM